MSASRFGKNRYDLHARHDHGSSEDIEDLSSVEDDDVDDDVVGEVGESIEIDIAALEGAFTSGLQSKGPEFLHELQRRVARDEELTIYVRKVHDSLQLLVDFIGEGQPSDNTYKNISLREMGDFGMPEEAQYRVGVLAFEIESSSPDSTIRSLATDSQNVVGRRERGYEGDEEENVYHDAPFVDIPARAAAKRSHGRVRLLSSGSDGYACEYDKEDADGEKADVEGGSYEDDFEIEDDGCYDKEGGDSGSEDSQGCDYAEDEHHLVAPVASYATVEPRRMQSAPVSRKTGVPVVAIAGSYTLSTPREGNSKPRATTSEGGRSKPAKAQPSWIIKHKWVLGEKIGTGSFGEVYQGMNDMGRLFAVKRLHIAGQRNVVDTLANEIQLMRDYAHPNIVGYLGAEVNEKEGVVNIFQEWVPGGSLAHLLGRFGPFKVGAVANYTRQILRGLHFLHSHGIIHRDIKGGNVLVDEAGNVKLADFGASTKVNLDLNGNTVTIEALEVKGTLKGTPYFMAPEVLGESSYGRKGDIWAVGCTIIQMLTGQPPWKDQKLSGLMQLFTLMQKWEGPPTYPVDQVSAGCREVIEWCFQRSEDARPNAEALLSCDFLRVRDELEDSDERSPMKPANLSNVSGGADLDDSGIMTDLRMKMVRLAQSTESLPSQPNSARGPTKKLTAFNAVGSGSASAEDTMKGVEKQLNQHQLSRQAENVNRILQRGDEEDVSDDNRIREIKKAAVNPYARSSAGVPPGSSGGSSPAPLRMTGPSSSDVSDKKVSSSDVATGPPLVTVPKRATVNVTRGASNTPISGKNRKSELPRPAAGTGIASKARESKIHGLSSARDSEGLTPFSPTSPYHNHDDSPLLGSLSSSKVSGVHSPHQWACMSCGKSNASRGEDGVIDHCQFCAVVRGSSGKKGPATSILRR